MCKVIGLDLYNQNITGVVAKTLTCMRVDVSNIPCVIVGGCYTIDEKMGQTYIHKDVANTLAARDYKQPQAVIYEREQQKLQRSDDNCPIRR